MHAIQPGVRPIALRVTLLLLLVLWLHGCATGPGHRGAGAPNHAVAERAAEIARSMEGRPYRYGGMTPNGFDCSGLVHYAYRNAGTAVPRTTRDQRRAIRARYLHQLGPGDLIFFRTKKDKGTNASHVGIYLGNGRFVHALNSSHPVRIDTIDDGYWRDTIVVAGSIAH